MGDAEVRSALGLKSSEWKTAREFTVALREIDLLSKDRNDGADKNKKFKWIAEQIYNILFQSVSGRSVLDKKRRCMWYFGRNVRFVLWLCGTS